MPSAAAVAQQTPAVRSRTGPSGTSDGARTGARKAPPWAIALAIAVPLALAYLIVQPPAGDLAAAIYRSDLFARVGFALRDNGWYAAHRHYLPGYSLLSPELGAWIGVYTVLALSAVAAAGLFGLIAQRVFSPAGARVAAGWFALGFGVGLLSGRVPYDLGFAIGLGSVLALLSNRLAVALGLAVLTSLASPVAGAFLALAGVACALIGGWERRGVGAGVGAGARDGGPGGGDTPSQATLGGGIALALATLIPIAVLALAFPEGGWEPFAPAAFWPALAGVLLIALLLPQGSLSTRGRLLVRVGAVLYALALIGSFALHTPVGGNSARLGALLAGPLLAGVLWDRHRLILCLLVPVLLYWQIETPINDQLELAGDPSVHASYYAPLRAELRTLTDGRRTIVEVPMTGAHGEAAYLAGHDRIALARGWERQLDTRYAHLFYVPGLTASAYAVWLRANRVAYVALPDVRLDEAGRVEGALIARGLPYLHELWHSAHWRLYAFAPPPR
ncbi:MAG TPA: hypothetical protein VGH60_07925 [Solirubrobacteraceae bacterium]|jgi:hypothetical protein